MLPSEKSTSDLVRQACRIEVLAVKPGNVSPNHDFVDASVSDFLRSAQAISKVLPTASHYPIGEVILNAVTATKQAVGHNTNLGIVLLLTPLCAVKDWTRVTSQLPEVLAKTTVEDAALLYKAIRIASPGGLGDAAEQDVAAAPTVTLVECMQLAAHRDSIAQQYCTDFAFVFDVGLDLLLQTSTWTSHFESRLGWVAVQILAMQSDSLITRKCGENVANVAQQLAQQTLSVGWPFESRSDIAYNALHRFLIDDEHQRNPGTTADLIAAILFCGLRSGMITSDSTETHIQFTKPKP